MESYLIAILTIAGIYAVLALALNIQFGMTGLINFGVVGFYGLGAYTSALVTELYGAPFIVGFAAAIVVGAVAGSAVSSLTLRLSGDYLAIVTLGFAETVRLVINNEDWLTRGPRGFIISTRPVPDQLGRDGSSLFYMGLIVAVLLIAFVFLERARRSAYGRTLRAIREDDLVPATLGKNVFLYRLQAFVIGSVLMAAAGSLYAHYVQTITPENFTTPIAILIWMSLIVGGAGNNFGAVAGALAVTVIYEGSRFLMPFVPWLDAEQMSSLRFIIIGVALIVVIRFRPGGLFPEPVSPPPKTTDASSTQKDQFSAPRGVAP